MVSDDILEERRLKSDLLIKAGVLSQKEAERYLELLAQLTDFEIHLFMDQVRDMSRFLQAFEPERMKYGYELWSIHAATLNNIHSLTKEQAKVLSKKIKKLEESEFGLDSLLKKAMSRIRGGEADIR